VVGAECCMCGATISDLHRIIAQSLRHLQAPQEDPLNNPPVSLLGPDILNDRPTAEQLSKVRGTAIGPSLRPNSGRIPHMHVHNDWCVFAQALGKKRSAIKSVIMDQSVLAGVGNWVRKATCSHRSFCSECVPSGRLIMYGILCRWQTRSCTRQGYTLVSVPVI
jgi:hypothetical protein